MKHTNNSQDQDGSYPIDAVSMPVRTVNYTIHNRRNGDEDEEILFLEIWTNGSLTPREALRDACIKFLGLFPTFLHPEEGGYPFERKKIKQIRIIHLIVRTMFRKIVPVRNR